MSFRQRHTSQPNLSGHLYSITWELLTKTAKIRISTEMVRRWGHFWGDDKGLSHKASRWTGSVFSRMSLSTNSMWSLVDKMETSGSIYWCKKAGAILGIEKTHDVLWVKPSDLEIQTNETGWSLIIYKIQAHAHRDKLPRLLQLSEVLPAENKSGKRPVYTDRMITHSSDLALPIQLPNPNRTSEGKRQTQDGSGKHFQNRQIKSGAHWTWSAV